MRRRSITLIATLFALVTGGVGTAGAQPRAVLGQSVVDVGIVSRGETVEQTFEIRNDGNETLELTDVKAACGCTVASYDDRIAPGATGQLAVTLSTKSLRGPTAKSVQVFTSDPRNPQLDFVIKADVRAYVDAEPGYARFLAVRGKGAEPAKQIVWSEEPGDFQVNSARTPLGFVDVEVREATDDERLSGRPGRQWVVEVSLDRNAPEGGFADFVMLDISHPRLRQMKIPVSGFVRPVVAVLPRVADFGRRDPATARTQVLEVRNLGDTAVSLGEVTSSITGVVPKLEVVEEGQRFRLELTLDPDMPKGGFSGKVTIPTTNALQPLLEIDVLGTVL